MTTYQQYLGQITIDSTCDQLAIDGNPIVLTSGDYYVSGYSGESTAQLCEHIEDEIQALGGGYATATVAYSASTGLITFTFSGSTAITWTDSALQTLLGFTGTQSGSSSYVATNTPKGVWRPSRAAVTYPGDLTVLWKPRSTTIAYRSVDGTLFITQGNFIYEAIIEYEHLAKTEVINDSTVVWGSLEKFFEYVAHRGKLIRIYPDRTLNASDSYHTGLFVPPGSVGEENIMLGSFDEYRERFSQSYNGTWNVRLGFWKNV